MSDQSRIVRIAGIQCAVQGDRTETIERIRSFTMMALEKGARLIVYPECFSLPWFHTMDLHSFQAFAESVPGPSTQLFLELSMQFPATFVCPIYEQDDNARYFSTVVIQSGQIVGVYRKIHLASAGGWEESRLAEPGESLPVYDLGFGKIGIVMGWDVFFPEALCSLALRGAEIIIAPTAAAMASKFRWLSVLSSHAVCNNVFVIRVNRCGKEKDLDFYGESFCLDPFGVLLDEPTFHRDSLMVMDLDLKEVGIARKEFPFLAERRPALYAIQQENLERRSTDACTD